MKKSIKTLLVGTALSASLMVGASASDVSFNHCADILNSMGLFSGTGTSYELDRTPTRAEAAVMLVRLLGGEAEATAENYATPFTDVPAWAAPYVGWLYHNGLTAGETATTYGTEGECTAQMYATFLMRSLGYTDSGSSADFTYKDAITFATEKGVVDFINCDAENFLRDHVVAMSYTALATSPKGETDGTLLDKLVSEGAVDAQKAAPVQKEISDFIYAKNMSEISSDYTNMDADFSMELFVEANDISLIAATAEGNVKADMNMQDLDKSKFALTGDMIIDLDGSLAGSDEEVTMATSLEAYYTDGVYYINTDGQKFKMPMSLAAIMQMMGTNAAQTTTDTMPIAMFDDIIISEDKNSIEVSIAPSIVNVMVQDSMQATPEMEGALMIVPELDKLSVVMDFTNKEMTGMGMALEGNMDLMGNIVNFSAGMIYDVNSFDDVEITLPSDLNTYVEIPAILPQ